MWCCWKVGYDSTKTDTITILIDTYNKVKYRKTTTAIKYYFVYHEVDVNIYFDAYDNKALSLYMVLLYNNKYYYTSLNIHNIKIKKEYLKNIPLEILKKILDDNNKLDVFFSRIESHLLNNKAKLINYSKDTYFTNATKYSKSKDNLPFLYSLRKAKMSSMMFKQILDTFGIEKNILEKIRNEGFTLVRTADFKKRKTLIALLENTTIKI